MRHRTVKTVYVPVLDTEPYPSGRVGARAFNLKLDMAHINVQLTIKYGEIVIQTVWMILYFIVANQ